MSSPRSLLVTVATNTQFNKIVVQVLVDRPQSPSEAEPLARNWYLNDPEGEAQAREMADRFLQVVEAFMKAPAPGNPAEPFYCLKDMLWWLHQTRGLAGVTLSTTHLQSFAASAAADHETPEGGNPV